MRLESSNPIQKQNTIRNELTFENAMSLQRTLRVLPAIIIPSVLQVSRRPMEGYRRYSSIYIWRTFFRLSPFPPPFDLDLAFLPRRLHGLEHA